MLQFVIPTSAKNKMPSMNDLIRAERTIFKRNGKIVSQGSLLKKKWQQYICTCIIRDCGKQKIEKPFTVHFEIFEPDMKRDIGNVFAPLEKYTMDALQDTQTIPNDNQKWYKGFSATFNIDRTNPRVIVTIKEIQESGVKHERYDTEPNYFTSS